MPQWIEIEISVDDASSRRLARGRSGMLRDIRAEYGVRIMARGGMVKVIGPERDARAAAAALEKRLAAPETVHDSRAGNGFEDVPAGNGIGPLPRGRVIRPRTEGQRHYLSALAERDLVFCIGPAGTGKTYLAVAQGVFWLHQARVKRLILVRPAVEAGEKLGFLPGDLREKVDPYLRPLYDALYDLLDFDTVRRYTDRNIIEVAPLAYMRGRTLEDAFIILDEAQNCTRKQMKMFLTRMGERSRTVVTGDVTQVDLPSGEKSGLVDAMEVLEGLEAAAFVGLTHQDVVRHALVKAIVEAYRRRSDGEA
ncbi:MAG: PhoH family protein [Planctomycetota bacterium]